MNLKVILKGMKLLKYENGIKNIVGYVFKKFL